MAVCRTESSKAAGTRGRRAPGSWRPVWIQHCRLQHSEYALVQTVSLPQARDLVIVRDRRLAEGAHQGNPIASGDFVELRRDNRVFAEIAASIRCRCC